MNNTLRDTTNTFRLANSQRDYNAYTKAMDAAVDAKAAAIFPHFGTIKQGDIIVDTGAGTGKLAVKAAQQFPQARVIAMDISEELLKEAHTNKKYIETKYGNALEQNFPYASILIKYFSTSGHEIETFGCPGSMQKAVRITFRELVPGGRIVIRDFAKPSLISPIYMQILNNVGLSAPTSGDIDYNILSTKALLERFQKEFQGGNLFAYTTETIDTKEYIKIDPEWAHEFYLRKDYTGNWRNEIKEKYTYWTMEQARNILQQEGFTDIKIIPELNEYIYRNRLLNKIALFKKENNTLISLPFPPTHMVISAIKI